MHKNGVSARTAFVDQFKIIHDALSKNTIIVRDFKTIKKLNNCLSEKSSL